MVECSEFPSEIKTNQLNDMNWKWSMTEWLLLLENAARIVAQEIQFQFCSLFDNGIGEVVIIIVISVTNGVHFLWHLATPI